MRRMTGLVLGAAALGLLACGRADDAEVPAAQTDEVQAEAPTTPTVSPGGLEVGFDRPSADLRSLHDIADAEACQAACRAEAECLAFTWVEAGVQAETPVCWLKNQVPGAIPADWATSGVIPGREPASSE